MSFLLLPMTETSLGFKLEWRYQNIEAPNQRMKLKSSHFFRVQKTLRECTHPNSAPILLYLFLTYNGSDVKMNVSPDSFVIMSITPLHSSSFVNYYCALLAPNRAVKQ